MATYKVLQDIEAEDTLVGPLTLRQCIYAAVAGIAGYLCFVVITKGAPYLVIFLLPFVAFGVFFAFPWSKQQPTEIWALAKVRFYFKPRKRIWNQSGIKQLVTITAPKITKQAYGRNLSPTEVTSRLKALADTIDSRGWAVKNVDMGYYAHPSVLGYDPSSDRLVSDMGGPQPVPSAYVSASEDMFDVRNNPVAQQFDRMMAQSATERRQLITRQLEQPQPPVQGVPSGQGGAAAGPAPYTAAAAPQPAQYWNMGPVSQPAVQAQMQAQYQTLPPLAAPGYGVADSVGSDEMAMMMQMQGQSAVLPAPVAAAAPQPTTGRLPAADYSNLRTPNAQPAAPKPSQNLPAAPQPAMTAPPNPAILGLASNNDLNVATIAREAQVINPDYRGEVDVPLRKK